MTISVIIPCRNEKARICDFLDSILAQELDPAWKLEVLIADGMSDDGTREILRDYSHSRTGITVIENPGRIVSTGLNAAIGAATGDVILRMDAHTSYANTYVRHCVLALCETGADNVGGPWVAEARGVRGEAIAAALRSRFCTGGGKAHDPDYDGEVDTVYLGCWNRSVFDRIGLFDTNLVRNQDDEFNFRLRRAGGRIWQCRRIQSWYTPRQSIGKLFRQYLQYGFWKVAVIRKHRALASWRHLPPVLFVSWITLSVVGAALAATQKPPLAANIAASLGIGLSIYFVCCVAASLAFFRAIQPRALVVLPFAMAVLHIAYGCGFLLGVLVACGKGSPEPASSGVFAELTR